MQGREIDMEKLMQKNELTQAVGNAKVNARGDKLGPGGKIIKTSTPDFKTLDKPRPNEITNCSIVFNN